MLPTNLLFNVTGRPGALPRCRRRGHLGGSLTRPLVLGTIVALFVVTRIIAPAVWRFVTMRATARPGSPFAPIPGTAYSGRRAARPGFRAVSGLT